MARHLNKLMFVGFLGRDPEMRYTPNGHAVCNFSVASSDQYTNSSGDKVETTTWFKCSSWNKAAEIHNQYLHKGSKVMVIGKLKADDRGNPRVFEGQNGAQASFEVDVAELYFLDNKGGNNSDSGASQMDQAPAVDDSDDSLPF